MLCILPCLPFSQTLAWLVPSYLGVSSSLVTHLRHTLFYHPISFPPQFSLLPDAGSCSPYLPSPLEHKLHEGRGVTASLGLEWSLPQSECQISICRVTEEALPCLQITTLFLSRCDCPPSLFTIKKQHQTYLPSFEKQLQIQTITSLLFI